MSENTALSQRCREHSCGRPPYYRCEMGLNGEKWCPVRRVGPCPQAVVQQFDLQHGSPCPPIYNKATAQLNPIHKTQGKARWIIGSIWSGGLLSPLRRVLITVNLHWGGRMVWNAPAGETKAWGKWCVHSPLGTATTLFTIIFVCRDSS